MATSNSSAGELTGGPAFTGCDHPDSPRVLIQMSHGGYTGREAVKNATSPDHDVHDVSPPPSGPANGAGAGSLHAPPFHSMQWRVKSLHVLLVAPNVIVFPSGE